MAPGDCVCTQKQIRCCKTFAPENYRRSIVIHFMRGFGAETRHMTRPIRVPHRPGRRHKRLLCAHPDAAPPKQWFLSPIQPHTPFSSDAGRAGACKRWVQNTDRVQWRRFGPREV